MKRSPRKGLYLVLAVVMLLGMAVVPAAFATGGRVSPSGEDGTSQVALTKVAAVPDAVAATLTVDGACVDTEPDGVCDAPGVYKTLKAAIAAASAGDTINVMAGTYVEAGQIVVDKSLTVIGADRATTIFKTDTDTGSSGDARGWFLVNGGVTFNLSAVTLDGAGKLVHSAIRTHGNGTFDDIAIKNVAFTTSSYDGRGVATVGDPGQTVTISNSSFESIARISVYIYGATATVTGNTIVGKGPGDWLDYGIEAEGGAVVTITGNTITDCEGVALVDGSTSAGILATTYFPGSTSITVEKNFITGNTGAVAVGYNATDTTAAVIHNNDLSGNAIYAVGSTGPAVDASGNWWGSNVPATVKAAADGGDVEDYTPWLNNGTDISGAVGFQGDFSNLSVDDDSWQTGSVGRIQEGINLVSGSTVNVAAGTYVESPNVTKPMKLLGAGSATTVINGKVTLNSSANGVSGDPLLIKGFDITIVGTIVELGAGLQYARIEDCKLGGGNPGIRVGSQANIAHVEFVNLTFYNNDIDVYFANDTLAGASMVDDVLFDNCSFTGLGKGIYAEKLSNAVIKNSSFTNSGNLTDANHPYYGQAIDINLKWGDYTNINIQDNTFTNSGNGPGTANVGGSAIGIKARGTGTDSGYASRPATLTNVTVTGNTFTGGQRGVRLGEPGKNNTGPTNVQIHNNKFIDIPRVPTGTDAAGAVVNGTTPLTNAENNWWGSACGPLASGASPVSANVDYSPFWLTDTGVAPTPAPITPTMSASDQCAQINSASPGSTITYGTGTYPGGVVVTANNVTIDLGGAEIGPGSPAYTIAANDVTLQNGTLNGALHTNGATSPAVLVQAGANNFTLSKVEVKNWADGVQVAGAVTSLKIVNNFIHNNTDAGLQVDGAVSGVATVEGNLFKVNGVAITKAAAPALPAQWNSFATKTCPTLTNVDTTNCAFAETFIDVNPDTLAAVRNVDESTSFNVKVVIDAQKLYGFAFKFKYDDTKLVKNSEQAIVPTGYACLTLPGLAANEIGYQCAPNATSSAAVTGLVQIGVANFTATGPGLTGNGPWDALFDVSDSASTAGTANGALVYLNNVKLAGVPNARDITETTPVADDGKIVIRGVAQFRGFIDVQGRADDSGAVLTVYPSAALSGALADATSAKGGSYTTAYLGSNLLTVGTTYHFVVDKALYVKTSATTAPSKELSTRAYTDLSTLVLKGGDANNSENVDVYDATCIGGAYNALPVSTCGGLGSADVNGDGKVDILDLTLMGGNFGIAASTWTP